MRGKRREGRGGVVVEGQTWVMLREGHAGHLMGFLTTELAQC